MEIEVFQDPMQVHRAQIKEFIKGKYGISDADPLALMCEFAYDVTQPVEIRFAAAKELLRYTYVVPKAAQQIDINHTGKVLHEQTIARDNLISVLNEIQANISRAGVAPVLISSIESRESSVVASS